MRTKHRDDRLLDDVSALRSSRKTAIIDRLKWVDPTLASKQIPGVKQRGNWFSAYDVRPRDLVEIIRVAPGGEISLLEVSIDLFPARGTAMANAPHQIVGTYLALQRRHAPITDEFLAPRIHFYGKTRDGRKLKQTAVHHDPSASATRGPVIRERLDVVPPQPVHETDTIRASTAYIGHKPNPTWSNNPIRLPGRVQTRLYIKVTDKRLPIPRSMWHTRIEVTLNSPPLTAVLGVSRLEDLAEANLRTIATHYMRLAVTTPTKPLRPHRRTAPALKALMIDRSLTVAQRDRRRAIELGNFAAADGGFVDYHRNPDLTELLSQPLYDYSRALKRAKTSGRSAKRPSAAPSRIGRKSLIHKHCLVSEPVPTPSPITTNYLATSLLIEDLDT